jgi:AraC-like DNA-binding protein
LQDEEFSIEDLGEALYLSRSQLHRKIKALTGKSTTLFIRSIRLQKARVLLESTDLSISEIAYRVGFKSPTYFSQIFKKEVGSSPVQFREKTI